MKKLLIPIVMLLLGGGGGVGAAIFLAPEAEIASIADAEDPAVKPAAVDKEHAADDQHADDDGHDGHDGSSDHSDADAVEYLDMNNQFIIPLLNAGVVDGIVVVSISIEVVEGTIATVNRLQPKIRDRFLQVLFNHANNGGFSGNFTEFRYIRSLKEELLRNAIIVAGLDVTDVLILDLVRQ